MGAAISSPSHGVPTFDEISNGYFGEKGHRTYTYTGWHGVGMSTAAKALAGDHEGAFDVVVQVTAGKKYSSPRKLQRRIAEELGLIQKRNHDDDDDGDDEDEEEEKDQEMDMDVKQLIYTSLINRDFLLIIDNLVQVQGGIDWVRMGIPTSLEWIKSIFLITTADFEAIRAMNVHKAWIIHTKMESESDMPRAVDLGIDVQKVYLDGVDKLMEHFFDEVRYFADTLGIDHEVGQVFNCFIYLCLFQQTTSAGMDAKELMKYYVGEGFITTAIQQPDGTDYLDGVLRHVEVVLGEMITRHMVEERSSSSSAGGDGKKFSMNSHLWKILDGHEEGHRYLREELHIQLEGSTLEDDAAARWVSLSQNKIQPSIPIIRRPLPWCAKQLTTLLLNDNPELKEIPDIFHQIPNLKVLDLSRTSISSFPPSLSSLVHLRFLKLQQCTKLNTLPHSLKHLKQLIILDLHGTPLSDSIPSEALQQNTNLRLLDLSHTKISYSLMPLLLSSVCNLNLERLLLSGCNAFTGPPLLTSMPSGHHHQFLRQLSELDISGCCEALKDVENVFFQDLPKLRALNLSHTPIIRLSIARCTSLEIVRLQGLTNLKLLHLSSIKIKEFPHEISELTQLEQLHLSDMKYLIKVDWKKVQWLPKKMEWDESNYWSSSRHPVAASNLLLQLQEELGCGENRGSGGGGAFISVSSANIFKGLSCSSQLWDNAFSKFHFYISPCLKQCDEKNEEDNQTRGVVGINVGEKKSEALVVYAGIYSKMNHLHLPDRTLSMGRRRIDFSRHLEIEGDVPVSSLFYWRGYHKKSLTLETVVKNAEVLRLHENRGSVKTLSDLKVEQMDHLKDCWVERCHNMKHLFEGSRDYDIHIKGPAQRLWVSDLGSLKCVCDGRPYFSLKHLHIECCPKLVTLFPTEVHFENLETLHIRFCARLESILKVEVVRSRQDWELVFPKLYAVRLWELPKLKPICPEYLHSLQYRVRACPLLQRSLPYLRVQACPLLQRSRTSVPEIEENQC